MDSLVIASYINCPMTCPKWEVSVNVCLGEGKVGSYPETCNDPF